MVMVVTLFLGFITRPNIKSLYDGFSWLKRRRFVRIRFIIIFFDYFSSVPFNGVNQSQTQISNDSYVSVDGDASHRSHLSGGRRRILRDSHGGEAIPPAFSPPPLRDLRRFPILLPSLSLPPPLPSLTPFPHPFPPRPPPRSNLRRNRETHLPSCSSRLQSPFNVRRRIRRSLLISLRSRVSRLLRCCIRSLLFFRRSRSFHGWSELLFLRRMGQGSSRWWSERKRFGSCMDLGNSDCSF